MTFGSSALIWTNSCCFLVPTPAIIIEKVCLPVYRSLETDYCINTILFEALIILFRVSLSTFRLQLVHIPSLHAALHVEPLERGLSRLGEVVRDREAVVSVVVRGALVLRVEVAVELLAQHRTLAAL